MYVDRSDAGVSLALEVAKVVGDDPLILALPRGGVPVAYEVARTLGAQLDIFAVRKLGVPGHEELAMGAVASGGVRVLNDQVIRSLRIDEEQIDAVTTRESERLELQEKALRGGGAAPQVGGREVVLVDDGLATGATMRAAIKAVKSLGASRVVVAVPVGASATCADLQVLADQVVCLRTPKFFDAVGAWYSDFRATSDDEVRELLERSRKEQER